MPMNADHFHTHDNFKIVKNAGKIIDQVSALKQRNAELEKENAALKAENEKLRSCLKCLDYRDLIKDSPEKKSVKELMEELK